MTHVELAAARHARPIPWNMGMGKAAVNGIYVRAHGETVTDWLSTHSGRSASSYKDIADKAAFSARDTQLPFFLRICRKRTARVTRACILVYLVQLYWNHAREKEGNRYVTLDRRFFDNSWHKSETNMFVKFLFTYSPDSLCFNFFLIIY